MARPANRMEGDGAQNLLRVLLTISAVWLMFWALMGALMFAVAGPGLTLGGEVRVLCLAVFAPPAALLALGLVGVEALSRTAVPAREGGRRMTRSIGVDHD